MTDVAVVIPAFNAAATIAAQLDALEKQEYAEGWRVVVVDNGSTDQTAVIVDTYAATFPVDLRVIRQPSNSGTGSARNLGVLSTEEPLILFCDSDDEVGPGWIAAMAEALRAADGAGGRIELDSLNTPDMLAWAAPTRMWEDSWISDGEWGMPSPIGACCAVTREAWSAVGGFNEHLRGGGEDADFYWRLQCEGRTLVDVPGAVVRYRLASTPRRLLTKLYRSGRCQTVLLWSFRHPKRRRQLLLESGAAVVRSYRVVKATTRRRAVHDLIWVAGRLAGLFVRRSRLGLGPDRRPFLDD